jgi:hypothetical protein
VLAAGHLRALLWAWRYATIFLGPHEG